MRYRLSKINFLHVMSVSGEEGKTLPVGFSRHRRINQSQSQFSVWARRRFSRHPRGFITSAHWRGRGVQCSSTWVGHSHLNVTSVSQMLSCRGHMAISCCRCRGRLVLHHVSGVKAEKWLNEIIIRYVQKGDGLCQHLDIRTCGRADAVRGCNFPF